MTFSTWYSIGNSVFHRAHPAPKIVFTLVMWMSAFIIQFPIANFLQFLAIVIMIMVSKVPTRKLLGFTKVTVPIIVAYFVLWPFLFGEGPLLGSLSVPGTGLTISLYFLGILWGLIAAFRLATVFYSTFFLLATTSDSQVIDGLMSAKFPYVFGFVLMITVRFLATLISDIASIQEARRARGLPERIGLVGFIRNLLTILLPLVMVSMRRVQVLTDAIEVRAFSPGRERTLYNDFKMRPAHVLEIVGSITFLILVVYLRFGLGLLVTLPNRI